MVKKTSEASAHMMKLAVQLGETGNNQGNGSNSSWYEDDKTG